MSLTTLVTAFAMLLIWLKLNINLLRDFFSDLGLSEKGVWSRRTDLFLPSHLPNNNLEVSVERTLFSRLCEKSGFNFQSCPLQAATSRDCLNESFWKTH